MACTKKRRLTPVVKAVCVVLIVCFSAQNCSAKNVINMLAYELSKSFMERTIRDQKNVELCANYVKMLIGRFNFGEIEAQQAANDIMKILKNGDRLPSKAELAGMKAKDVALKLKEIANGKASMWTLMWQGWKLRMFGLRISIREYGPAIAISAGLATLIALGCLAWWEIKQYFNDNDMEGLADVLLRIEYEPDLV
jgi:hypothetical protein